MSVEIMKFTTEDAEPFFEKRDEVAKSLRECMLLSQDVFKGMIDGELACVWGLVTPSLLSNQAYLWLLTTDIADRHQFMLVRHSQMVIKDLLGEYEKLTGHVKVDHERSQRWLKWLGAELKYPEQKGKLIPFEIRRK